MLEWTAGLPPKDLTKRYLVDGHEWHCPALMNWSHNTQEDIWYLNFCDNDITHSDALTQEEVIDPRYIEIPD